MGNGQKLDTNNTQQEELVVAQESQSVQVSTTQETTSESEASVAVPSDSVVSEKLKSSKEVIHYLAQQFPACFIAEGEARPLKIGIFQDLAARLKDDPKVSNTLMRGALRQYTCSWRYLHGLKPGAKRVDLDGNECGELEQEHIDHAQQTLKESKERAFAKRKSQQATAEKSKKGSQHKVATPAGKVKNKPVRAKSTSGHRAKPKSQQPHKNRTAAKEKPNLTPINLSEVKVGSAVHVMLSQSPVAGTVTKLEKDGVMVQLNSGMTVQVKPEYLVN